MKLNLDNCIILTDVKKIQKEPPLPKIKTLRRLVKAIHKKKLIKDVSEPALYHRIYKIVNEGFSSIDEKQYLINAILAVLNEGLSKDEVVTEKELVI